MGVPRLYPWITKNFASAIKRFQQGEYRTMVDYLYLDGNSFLHGATQEIYNYGDGKRKMDTYKNLSDDTKRKKAFSLFFDTIIQLSQIVVPQKALYIAIDGPAPLAKQNQQRERRFSRVRESHGDSSLADSSHGESGEESHGSTFDSSALTPGTTFMLELSRYMNYAIRKEMNSFGAWRNIDIYFSPATVEGEGEHKFVQFIKDLSYEERIDSSHCMYGNDGDLIMLALAVHVPNIFLFREGGKISHGGPGPGHYDLLDMGMIRNDIKKHLPIPPKNDESRNQEDIINDFIVEGFFVGNDFLPKIQMFHVGNLLEEGLGLMLKTYRHTSKGVDNFLVIDGKLDLRGFKAFVGEIAKSEEKFLKLQISRPVKPRYGAAPLGEAFKNVTLSDCITKTLIPGSKEVEYYLDMEMYRQRYYKKCGFPETPGDKKFDKSLKIMCHDYLKSFIWVFKYYVHGLASWRWAYEHHYAPLMVDFNNYLQSLNEDEFESISKFDLQTPSLPFEQLLSVLPPPSSKLLPKPYRSLMTNPKSPLVKLGYYPSDFKVDYEGKIKEHEGIVLLPFVNYDNIHKYYTKTTERSVKNPEKYTRNILGKTALFRYDGGYTAQFTSKMGNIDRLHIRKTYTK